MLLKDNLQSQIQMDLSKELSRRIVIMDGAMGSMIQSLELSERDYFYDGAPEVCELKGNNECLNLSRPDIIRQIHRQYIEAGADIIGTNSFGANRLSQAEYGCGDDAARMAFAAAGIAREAVAESGRDVLVAGCVGPSGKSLTLAQDMDRPAYRECDFDTMSGIFREQMEALIKGGVDLILLETCFDALTTKSAIAALDSLGNPVPLIISATISDRSGRTLTGQTLEAFYHSVRYAPTLCAFGINCALGASEMAPLVEEVASFSTLPLIFYPNAGLPDGQGHYHDTPCEMSSVMVRLAQRGLLNIVGGCCGSTPGHIAEIASVMKGLTPRTVPQPSDDVLVVSGLEAVRIDRRVSFTNIGERTNVTGSRKFARLIANAQYDEALEVASAQIEGGANIIDINMDDAMLDSAGQMRTYLRYVASVPSVAKAAVMIDSSHFDTIVEGLKNTPGKSIVNSISLKDGEDEFLRRAGIIKSFGAAMVVMAFDENGQAVTYQRKIEICRRSYDLLTRKAGIRPADIIFDVNVLSIGTGIADHARFGIDFIEAVRWIKTNLTGALTSGGISNLSFAFRGNNAVREAMHSVFLYHAIAAGLDMAIVNPQMLQIYDDIDPELISCIEDVIFNRRDDATARLVDKASGLNDTDSGLSDGGKEVSSDNMSAPERLQRALMRGDGSTLETDVRECLELYHSAVDVIEGPLVSGMEKVGELFSCGKMFLPQIVRSAKIMKDAVSILQPYIKGDEEGTSRPSIVMATVQGDVHDIGKNIVGTVLQCSGFQIIDLGVMVPVQTIVGTALERKADIIAVSGLITPSLRRMEELCVRMSELGMTVPLFVGGAAASALHTAVRLAPLYANVHYRADASATAVMAKRYMQSPEEFIVSEREEHARLREISLQVRNSGKSADVRDGNVSDFLTGLKLENIDVRERPAADFEQSFDWRLFNTVCGIGTDSGLFHEEALSILRDRRLVVSYCMVFNECRRRGDAIVGENGIDLPMLRQEGENGYSLADYFPDESSGITSPLGLFAVCVTGLPDTADNLVAHAVKVTLAETVSAWLRSNLSANVPVGYKVILPAVGYACCPDHSLKRDILGFLPDVGISLTDSCAMMPEASICGMAIVHRNAAYGDIRRISGKMAAEYAAKRGFTEAERNLFLASVLN